MLKKCPKSSWQHRDFSVMFTTENEIIRSSWRQIYRLLILHRNFENCTPLVVLAVMFYSILVMLQLPWPSFSAAVLRLIGTPNLTSSYLTLERNLRSKIAISSLVITVTNTHWEFCSKRLSNWPNHWKYLQFWLQILVPCFFGHPRYLQQCHRLQTHDD